MLKVQEYLLENGLESLESEYGIVSKNYDDIVVLNYSQIDSPKNNPMVDECRGLILSSDFNTVLCRPFDRFYNMGEAGQTVDNVDNYTILEKYDGSLINIWYNPFTHSFQASTRGTGYAESPTPYGNTFYDIIERDVLGFKVSNLDLPIGFTYIFELVGPANRVVKMYDKPEMYLIGVRHNKTGQFLAYDVMNSLYLLELSWLNNVHLAKKYSFSSIDDIVNNISSLDAMDEGYVLWNENTGHRVKIKNPDYVAIHHLRDNGVLVPRRIVHLIHENEHEEYLSYFECDRQFFQPYIDAYNKMVDDIERIWVSVRDIESQKEFALSVKDLYISGVLFGMRKGFTIKDCLDKMTDKKLAELVEKYKE